MSIRAFRVYQVDLPLFEGGYNRSGGKSVTTFDSSVIEVESTEGITGLGEVCPLCQFYLPTHAYGVRAGIKELSPHLIGYDACVNGFT